MLEDRVEEELDKRLGKFLERLGTQGKRQAKRTSMTSGSQYRGSGRHATSQGG